MTRDDDSSAYVAASGYVDPSGSAAVHVGGDAASERERAVHGIAMHQLELAAQNQSLRESQATLEESRAAYAALYDDAPVGHLSLDRFGNVRQLNLTCAKLLGRERRALEGLPLRVLLDDSSRGALDAHLRTCVPARETTTVELTVLAGEGPRAVELVTAPSLRLGHTGTKERMIIHSAMIDISERRRMDARRETLLRREREARLLAEHASQVKEDFLAVMSHELRAPLAPLLLWLRALHAGGASEGLRTRAIAAMEASIKVQAAMIDDLVDVARGRHDMLHIERRPIDLRGVVAAVVDSVAPAAAAKLIRVELELTNAMACVSGDALRLRQVTQNLLTNSLKFTPEGGHVTVSLSVAKEDVVLVVSDDGEGMDAKVLEEIFEPFRQGERTHIRRHGGMGLGLTIVRQLVTGHGGVVTAHSAGRGLGSLFTVTLPRHDTAAFPLVVPLAETGPAPKDSLDALVGLHVLIIEDQQDTRDVLELVLRSAGAEVVTAASADEGLTAVRAAHPNVVISDVGLPGEDGYVFVQSLRAWELETQSRRLPVIALTAHAGPSDMARAVLAGFDQHVAKPVDFASLVSTIDSVVQRN